jgi:hypothetical protein
MRGSLQCAANAPRGNAMSPMTKVQIDYEALALYRRLADWAFNDVRPHFVQPFYEHVRAWRRDMHRQFWLLYDADGRFRWYLETETLKRRKSPNVPYRGFYD